MRPILTQAELNSILHSADIHSDAWIDDENRRKQHYRDLITSGNCAALVRMVHAIHKHKEQQHSTGRKLHLCDENFLRDAEKLLGSEISLVLNIDHGDVRNYMQRIFESN